MDSKTEKNKCLAPDDAPYTGVASPNGPTGVESASLASLEGSDSMNDPVKGIVDKGISSLRRYPDSCRIRLLAGDGYWTTSPLRSDGAVAIPQLRMSDGPNGIRLQGDRSDNLGISQSFPATCFPCACASAASFDDGLLELMGSALGCECREVGVDIILGPGINIKRHPLGGRNFEYFSEDPYLSGRLGAAYIRGVQSCGVGACCKHLSANSQELRRMTSDSVVDEATLHDIYLRAFEIAVRQSHPVSVMTAYNRLNGAYCSENKELLRWLRDDVGFDGVVVSDWGGMDDSVLSVSAGLGLCMPGPRSDHLKAARDALAEGSLTQGEIDRSAGSVAGVALHLKEMQEGGDTEFDCIDNLAIAQVVAEASCVLLENDGALPIDPDKCGKIALIGAFAKRPRHQGSGSSKVNPIMLDNAHQAFCDAGLDVLYAPGYNEKDGTATSRQLNEAVEVAKRADVAFVFVGLPDSLESEGFDRSTLALPEAMNRLVDLVCDVCDTVVAIVISGGVCELPWRKRVSALLVTYLLGSRGGHALANVVTGVVNPSGRLPETWPERLEDTALGSSFPIDSPIIPYIEATYVGYRYFDAAGIEPAYCFGFGLSYTRFEYIDLHIDEVSDGYDVSFDIANIGGIDGAEVSQVYVVSPGSAPHCRRSLEGYSRVFVYAKTKVRVSIHLGSDAFAHWSARVHEKVVTRGTYRIEVGASSRDIRLLGEIEIDGSSCLDAVEEEKPECSMSSRLSPYINVSAHGFDDRSFEALLGHPIPDKPPLRPFTPNSRIGDLAITPFGRLILFILEWAGNKVAGDDEQTHRMLEGTFTDMPLRAITLSKVPYRYIEALVDTMNRHPVKALKRLFGM